MTVDELLTAMEDVGLQLWMLCDNGAEGWYCVLHDRDKPCVEPYRHDGNGATAVEALAMALRDAGVEIEL